MESNILASFYEMDKGDVSRFARKEKFTKKNNGRYFFNFLEVKKLFNDKKPFANRIISCAAEKGGVGKTTTSIMLAQTAAAIGADVLVIDLDPQANCTIYLNELYDDFEYKTLYDYFFNDLDSSELILKSIINGIDIIPSHPIVREVFMRSGEINNTQTYDLLDSLKNKYDLIIIDCPPSMNRVIGSFVIKSDHILSPFIPHQFVIDGIELTEKFLFKMAKSEKIENLDLIYFKNIWPKNNKTNLSKKYEAWLLNNKLESSLNTEINKSEEITKSIDNYRKFSENPKEIRSRYIELLKEVVGG